MYYSFLSGFYFYYTVFGFVLFFSECLIYQLILYFVKENVFMEDNMGKNDQENQELLLFLKILYINVKFNNIYIYKRECEFGLFNIFFVVIVLILKLYVFIVYIMRFQKFLYLSLINLFVKFYIQEFQLLIIFLLFVIKKKGVEM